MIWKKYCIHGWYILSAFLFLAACNGDGGGGGGTAQAPAEINVSALLTRSQENPAFTNFSSSGAGSIAVDPATRKISGVIVTSGVLGTAAPYPQRSARSGRSG